MTPAEQMDAAYAAFHAHHITRGEAVAAIQSAGLEITQMGAERILDDRRTPSQQYANTERTPS